MGGSRPQLLAVLNVSPQSLPPTETSSRRCDSIRFLQRITLSISSSKLYADLTGPLEQVSKYPMITCCRNVRDLGRGFRLSQQLWSLVLSDFRASFEMIRLRCLRSVDIRPSHSVSRVSRQSSVRYVATSSNEALTSLSLSQAKEWLSQGKTTSEELVNASLSRCEQNEGLNAFITIRQREELLNEARASDKKRREGSSIGALEGIPLSIKDNFCVKGVKTSCASRMLENYTPPYTSTVAERLSQSGAILLGKTNMDEFAMGSTSSTGAFGSVINPHTLNSQQRLSAGGSSGGSACAVATGMSFASIGSDTGGSIRQPAALCGVIGLKPSYGLVSRFGMVAFGSSLDCPGLFTRTVEDTAQVLQVISGHDARDANTTTRQVPNYMEKMRGEGLKGLTIGIPTEYNVKELNNEIRDLWMKGASDLQRAGANVVEISLPNTMHALPSYYVIAPAEAFSNLARYDGLRFGSQSKGSSTEELYSNTRSESFNSEVQRRILLGGFVLSRKSVDSYYLKAQRVRRLVRDDFHDAFSSGVDVILTPTTPTPALPLDNFSSPVEMYVNDVMTIPASLAGLPAISLPVGRSGDGLPLGLQLIGSRLSEDKLFEDPKIVIKVRMFKIVNHPTGPLQGSLRRRQVRKDDPRLLVQRAKGIARQRCKPRTFDRERTQSHVGVYWRIYIANAVASSYSGARSKSKSFLEE
ncbi:aspartyl/glutamyl-tRNA amidotransferase subunit A [Planoprotostelium fungivorum]|uniref:Glutamyl-tRNA(Gln) amidotransferase subunit A, mitochondrial n=1 Tax=Planoprotostelium fungivorum TaxID=1890364 RepID=A0A2P6NZU6_9EUKA|nr:aspartyl/glutamyl-tRNA amidotransferase subunit A [Planoprotostelium fungivorum]